MFFLGPLCEGAPPAGGGGENLFPGDYDYIRQGRGHNVCLAVSRDGEHIDSKQCLLYNKDYPAVLTCHVRDPKVFAYEGRYYMVLGARTVDDRGEVLVLESTDRLHRMTLPRVLTHDGQGHILQNPAPELTACRGAAVALPDGAEQAVDICFDLTAAPAGDFSLAFDGGLTLAYADADRTCYLTFTDDAMSGGRTSRYVKLDAPCRRPHGAVRLCPSRIFLHGTCIFCQMSLFDEMIAKIL